MLSLLHLDHVWPDQVVGDTALHSYIMDIRKAIGDGGNGQRLLRTIRGRGYRFIAPVELQDPACSWPIAPAATIEAAVHAAASGSGVAPTTPYADGEYKLASILCGALSEASALVARLGPEPWYRLRQTAMGMIQEVLLRYGGALTLATHDGFTAVFGVPVAQEDHTRRAVLAALELRQHLRDVPNLHSLLAGDGLSLSMGLDSGMVVAGEQGQEPQRLATVVGAPFHVATQLRQQATPGTILLSEAAYQLVRTEIRAVPYRSPHPDGPSMVIYAAQGLLQRHAGVIGRGLRAQSPFVGRARELALLHDHLAAAVGGQGQVVGVVGAPGMGKSRLLTEFCRQVSENQVTIHEGQCLSYGQATPYLPVRDIVRQVCGLAEADESSAQVVIVQQRLQACGVAAEDDVALLLQLLDLPVDSACLARLSPEARQVRAFALLRHLILDAAQDRPLVLLVENLHWSDTSSEAWLTSLAERLAGAAVLLLGTYRPGYQPAWGTHTAVTQVALSPLPDEDSRTIIQAVSGTAPLPETQLQTMVSQAGGNPFFLEELACHAIEQGGRDAPASVPDTVRAVLAARIDWLFPEVKRLLQTAAVIGPEVPVSLLQALADCSEATLHHHLAHLQAAEFLYETQLLPEHVYTFKHALTHEVAYGSLLEERRRVLHTRLVENLESLAPEGLAEQVERLAHHALRGEVWDKVVAYCRQAGVRAYDRAAFRESVAFFDCALQALGRLSEDGDTRGLALDLRLALTRPLRALGEYGRHRALLGEAETLARASGDQTRLAQVLAGMCHVLMLMGDNDNAIAVGQQALKFAAALGESASQVQASLYLGRAYLVIGDFARAAELLRWSVEAADREPSTLKTDLQIETRAWLTRTLIDLGAFAEGQRHGEEALRLAALAGRGETPITAYTQLGHLFLAKGDLEHAIWLLNQGLTLCRASGNRSFLRPIAAGLGYAYALQGRLAEARALLEEGLRENIRTGGLLGHAHRVTWLSEIWRLEGRNEEAWQYACQALDLARQLEERCTEALALYQLGMVQAHANPPDVAPAETHYQQAMALAKELGMRPLQAHCHRGLGTLYVGTGQHQQARAELSKAIEMYRAMDMTLWLPQAEAVLETPAT